MTLNSIYDLMNLTFSVNVLSAIPVEFPASDIADYSSNGRNHNLIHLITSGDRTYYCNGTTVHLKEGTVIFIPDKTRYVTECSQASTGIGICFDFNDGIEFANGVYSCSADTNGDYYKLFTRLIDTFKDETHSVLHRNVLFLRILDRMTLKEKVNARVCELLEPAVKLMKERYTENLPTSVYANACGLSESYFRSLFKERFSMSPIKYRNILRFEKVRSLRMLGLSVSEIAEKCGFCNEAYLRLVFKRETGESVKRCSDNEMV